MKRFKQKSLMAGLLLIISLTALTGCARWLTRLNPGPRDELLGWYQIQGSESIIPIFKRDGVYYSVCRWTEVPLKVCPEGLEWAEMPSSMTGTTIIYDRDSSHPYYIRIVDAMAAHYSDGESPLGEKRPMFRIAPPQGLQNPTLRRPRELDDFCGWYQFAWQPAIRMRIQKTDGKYFFQTMFLDETGAWKTEGKPEELQPLSDGLGFAGSGRKSSHHLIYNDDLRRFEINFNNGPDTVVRLPLARIKPPTPESDAKLPQKRLPIGIPAWRG